VENRFSNGSGLTMCGIAGFVQRGVPIEGMGGIALGMVRQIRHRGPDDFGFWGEAEHGIALAHARLSILDLSPTGRQPMQSSAGRYTIVFNGEIYNHLELRARLPDFNWRGSSDTETLLAAVEAWGVEGALRETASMFALAIWDAAEHCLYLARDRLGEKPLYYGWQGDVFLFGSELKALKAHPLFAPEIDRQALAFYARNGFIGAPQTIYRGIRKLMPGTILELRQGAASPVLRPYWDSQAAITHSKENGFSGDAHEAVAQLDEILKRSVKAQMLSDVPLGAFLSGGIDSSTIVSLMQSVSSRPVKTFTIGYGEKTHNEAIFARDVAKHLGTDHTELYVSSDDALNLVPELPTTYDEPFADSSQIPTMLVSRMARQHVTVALSGDGGDELFGGYGRYAAISQRWRKLGLAPGLLRATMARILPPSAFQEGIGARSLLDFYTFTNRQWKGFPSLVLQDEGRTHAPSVPPILDNDIEKMMFADMTLYLPDDILAKVDRAAMATSLETRVPMLDHRVVEFAWSLPMAIKGRDGASKWPLKQVLYRYVPEALVNRPKMGFAVPVCQWLRGPLRDWAGGLLSADLMKAEGFFDVTAVQSEWKLHLSGRRDRSYGLWTILMFQAWLRSQQVV